MDVRQVMHDLAAYALTKKGGELAGGGQLSNDTWQFDVKLPHVQWGDYFEAMFVTYKPEEDDNKYARLPVALERLASLMDTHSSIRKSTWAERDGMCFIDVPLDGNVSMDAFKSLIDESHALIWSKLDPEDVALIEAASGSFDESALIETLIAKHDLTEQRDAIVAMMKPAHLVRPIEDRTMTYR